MKTVALDFEQIPQLSSIDKAYQKQDSSLAPFYEHTTDIEQFEKVILAKKNFALSKRRILVESLKVQYQDIETTATTLTNIEALSSPNTFTVTTAHQPNLFSGPLYSIYKIVSTINLAKQLKQKYPKNDFVPIFWTGGEDHDFEEVNHFNLFGKTIKWENEQGGSVGKYTLENIQPILEEVVDILGDNQWANTAIGKILDFYTTSPNYGKAHTKFINWIFGAYGLVILNANTAALKEQMQTIFEDELLHHNSKRILTKAAADLEEAGFSNQAYAREINLFYLTNNKRSRIVKEGTEYKVLDTNLKFTEAEILQELDQNPQNFSPNVILRPLFQEVILPNLAYIGGGGELAYWLERKEQFHFFGVPYPMLVRRCSVLWVDKTNAKKLKKLAISVSEIFEETPALVKKYTLKNTENELSLNEEKKILEEAMTAILEKGKSIDTSLKKAILGTQTQIINSVEKIEKKLIRAEKSNHENALNQIRNLKGKLFPNNSLQERYDTFLAFYVRYGNHFIETLIDKLHPLEKDFVVLVEEN